MPEHLDAAHHGLELCGGWPHTGMPPNEPVKIRSSQAPTPRKSRPLLPDAPCNTVAAQVALVRSPALSSGTHVFWVGDELVALFSTVGAFRLNVRPFRLITLDDGPMLLTATKVHASQHDYPPGMKTMDLRPLLTRLLVVAWMGGADPAFS